MVMMLIPKESDDDDNDEEKFHVQRSCAGGNERPHGELSARGTNCCIKTVISLMSIRMMNKRTSNAPAAIFQLCVQGNSSQQLSSALGCSQGWRYNVGASSIPGQQLPTAPSSNCFNYV